MQGMSGKNSNIPRAEWFGAAQSGAAGRDGTEQDRTPTGRFAQEITVPVGPKGIEDNCPEHFLASSNKGLVESKTRTLYGLVGSALSLGIDPQGSVCTGCCTGCRVSARVNCRCTRHRLE